MLSTTLALLLLAAPNPIGEGVKLYGEGRYLSAARKFAKPQYRNPESIELRFAYLFSLKNCGYVQHVTKALAVLKEIPRQENETHEALRQFGIADSHRRLAELHQKLFEYYSSDPESELAPIERRKAVEHAKAAQTALRTLPSEQWQPLIDYGLACAGSILGDEDLDAAAKQIDSYARLAAATRTLWADRRERGMVFDPLDTLRLFAGSDAVYESQARRSIKDEVAARMLLSRGFQRAEQLGPALAQCRRCLALDPANEVVRDRIEVLEVIQRIAQLREETDQLLGRKK